MEDNLLRSRPKSTLPTLHVGKAAAKPPEPEAAANGLAEPAPWNEFDPLPQPGSPYTAFSRPGNKPEIVLHVMTKDGFFKGYAWSNFDSVDLAPSNAAGTGPILVIRFAGLVPTELRITGSNLGRLHAYTGRQLLAWIREHPSKRGFGGIAAAGDNAEIITGIIIQPWKPERS